MRVCQHFLFLCSNGGYRRHRAVFDAGKFVIEFSPQKNSSWPQGELQGRVSRRKFPAEITRNQTLAVLCACFISDNPRAFDANKPLSETSKDYFNKITNYPYIVNMSFDAWFQRLNCVKSTKLLIMCRHNDNNTIQLYYLCLEKFAFWLVICIKHPTRS